MNPYRKLFMPPRLRPLIALALLASNIAPAAAGDKKLNVPDGYDGSWSIAVATKEGPCPDGRSYGVRIAKSDVSYPGDGIDVDGSVAAGGGVRATITKGTMTASISGDLERKGTGTGTWRSTGDSLFTCSGTWSARRGG